MRDFSIVIINETMEQEDGLIQELNLQFPSNPLYLFNLYSAGLNFLTNTKAQESVIFIPSHLFTQNYGRFLYNENFHCGVMLTTKQSLQKQLSDEIFLKMVNSPRFQVISSYSSSSAFAAIIRAFIRSGKESGKEAGDE